jgi:serine/threonine protein kinase
MEDPKHTSVGVGDVLAGKYRVDGVLGTGGMGVVVAAHHLQLDERVALKFLLPEALANEEAVMRFEQEARAAVKITSEHVARVIDVGALESGAPYIVMELLDGCDLSAWIREKGALPVEQAVEFVLHACEAIAEAHSLGIVHRDLKPANLFVVRRNDGLHSVKVLDFGISKVRKSGGGDLSGTKTSVIMGSPFYMSPEQMRSSKDVDPQSDIWALGVILYELLAGQTPFAADTYAETCVRVMTEPPIPLRELRPDVPPALAGAIDRCLEKDRRLRHADVAEFALSLQEFCPRRAKASIERIHGVLGRDRASTALPPLPSSRGPIATMSQFGRTTGAPRATKRSAWGIAAVTAIVLLLMTAAGAFGLDLARSRGYSPTASAAFVPWLATPNRAPEAPVTLEPLHDHADRTTASAPPTAPPVPLLPAAAPPELPAPPIEPAPTPAPEAVQRHTAVAIRPATIWRPAPAPVAALVSPPASEPEATPKPSFGPAASAPQTTPTVDCETPFYFDATGTRIFKKECVH